MQLRPLTTRICPAGCVFCLSKHHLVLLRGHSSACLQCDCTSNASVINWLFAYWFFDLLNDPKEVKSLGFSWWDLRTLTFGGLIWDPTNPNKVPRSPLQPVSPLSEKLDTAFLPGAGAGEPQFSTWFLGRQFRSTLLVWGTATLAVLPMRSAFSFHLCLYLCPVTVLLLIFVPLFIVVLTVMGQSPSTPTPFLITSTF